jgi:hypothetical protein
MCNRNEVRNDDESWLHGVSGESQDRQCPNCGQALDPERIEPPGEEDGLLLCPDCGAELPWESAEELPADDWFNWACLERIDYAERSCFDEPRQKALSLSVSLADPRGADVSLEVSRTRSGDVLVKVVNQDFTYYPYVSTSIEGSYTVIRFRPR